MADKEISQFTDGSAPSDANYVGGYATANTVGGNRRWSFANIATYVNTKLGLGTMSIQNADNVAITGGTVDSITSTSATLITPALGTPASGVLTNCTGTASGLTSGHVTTNANLTGMVTSSGNAAVLGSFTSANLAAALTDETGSGAAVFATSPTLVTPNVGVATATSVTMSAASGAVILKQGANGKVGTFVANGVTPVTVNNSSITANSNIIFTLKTIGGTVGAYPAIQTITPATGFTVSCTALDTSTYNYAIIESAA